MIVLSAACNGSPALASLQLAAANDQPATEVSSPSVDLNHSAPAARAGRDVVFRRLTLDDGLSQSSINCIVQDAQGFMWFGTQDGLNRYDGYEIKVYRHDPENPHSLSNSYVMGCKRDRRGVVWLVTRDGVLHRYEPETERFVRYDLGLSDPFQQRGSELLVLHGDVQGRLWVGTFGDGLLRYEPEEDTFRAYRHDPDDPTSLSHRIVWRIHEDREGTIWVGTEAGLNRYDPGSDSFVRYPYRDFPPGAYQYDPPVHDDDPAFQPANPRALGSPAVTRIAEDGEGRLWVGTRYGGLNRLDRETGDFTSYPYDPAFEPEDPGTLSGNSVHRLLVDHLGQLWVGSAHWNVDETRTYARLGVERLDPETGSILRFPADPEDPCSLPHDYVGAMYEDAQGTLWVHTFGGGVDIYDQETGCFDHYVHDPDDERTLAGDDVTVFYEDEAGGLWIGTATGGASYFDPGWAKFPSYDVGAESGERLSNNSIWRIASSPKGLRDDGRADVLWVSTFAGLNYWDRRANTFTFYEIDPKLPDSVAYSVFEDAERRVLWLGTTMGLERAGLPAEASTAPETLRFTRILTRSSASTGSVLAVHPAGEDQLWVGQYRVGLHRFDLTSEEIVATYRHDPDDEMSLGDDRVLKIFPGRDGTLWLTTRGGLECFDPESATFTHYLADPEDPRSGAATVHAVYEDRSGNVWLGTDGEGLQRLVPAQDAVVAAYREEDGLPNNVVYSILPGEAGQLWLSTNRGLVRFDPLDESFQSYTSQDGLQSNEFNWGAEFSAADGELFFGGVNGINAFYPAEIAPNPYVPPVVITEILLGPPRQPREIGGRGNGTATGAREVLEAPLHLAEEIELSHRDRILSFEFAALHYALPERNQYAYMLEGFDPDWHEVGTRRFATYTNLPPGRYTFRVKGSNSDGVWNDQGASVTVRVRPPFWGTWWFRAMVGLLLLGGGVAGYRVRVRAIEARSRELEGQVAERTQELEAVNAIAAVVSRSLELDDLLCDALDETLTVMGTKAGGIYLLDEAADVLHIAVQRGFRADVVEAIDNLVIGEGFSGRVAASGEPLVVRDIAGDARLTRLAVQEEGLRSLAVVPLLAKGRVLGTLFTVTRGYRAFSDRDVALLTAIGQQIGVAVDNAALYEDTRNRLAQLTALQETTMAVASTLELGRLLRLIVQQATTLLEADGGILNLVDWATREDEVVAAVGIGALSIGIRSGLETELSGWVTLHDEGVVSNDTRADERIDRAGLLLMESEYGKRIVNTAVAPLRIKDQVVGTLVIVNKRGGEVDLDESDLGLLQAFANQAATAIENARLFEAEQRRAEQFRVISEVGRRITSITSLDSVLQQVVELIQGALDYDHVHIGLVDGDEVTYRVGAGHLWDDPDFQFEPARLKVGQNGITGWVAATGEPILLPDVSQDPRYVWMRGSGTRSELTVPIKLKGEVIGVLDAQSDRLDAFDESDLTVLQSLADQAAIAIENARLYERAQRLAVMEERQRLARELHDSVTQALYGATLYAEATARQLDDGRVALAAEHLRELRDTAQEALREMRLLIFELRPSVLESDGLVNALRARLEAVEERAGLEVAFRADEGIVLPMPVEEGLYRIAQEALNNALKHACARRISVSLERREGSVVLDVVDDGCGFDPATAVPAGGLGLDGMIERAAELGGELVLNSEPGVGTTVRVEVAQ
jgi:signal transduction histidine kinase/ligand-binding sensor domain-containing protein